MSQQYPPPPGVDSRQSNNASRYGNQPAPPGYRPPPPSYGAPPPPAQHSDRSRNNDSYASNRHDRYDDRDRDRARDNRERDRDRDWDRADRSGRNDRGTDRAYRDDRYEPSSRRNDSYSLPPRPSESFHNSRNGGDSFRPPQGDFTFRADKPFGVGESFNSYRPSDQNGSRGPHRGPAGRGRGGRLRGGFARRGPFKKFQPSERALLQVSNGDQVTEDFADEENGPSFKAFDQLSDSDEAEMDMSDSDNQSGEPTTKRVRTTTKPDDGDSVPKWSNPDPYTALPPLEDADKKKKDMVHMIRKARVETSGARTSLAAPGADQDFLRFDSDSDEAQDDSEEFIDPLTYNRGPASPPRYPARSTAHPLPNKPGAASTSGPDQVAFQLSARHESDGLQTRQNVIDLTQSSTKTVVPKRPALSVDLAPSADLGTRKRTHNDVLVLPAHSQLKDAPRQPAGGKLVSDWRPKAKESACPWMQITTSQAHINIRLHMEVTDFYEHIKPRQFEDRLRAKLVDDLNYVVSKRLRGWPNCSMYPFGSYMSGLYLPTGDMDLVFCSKAYVNGGVQSAPSKSQMRRFVDFVRGERLAADGRVNGILHARVPLVKYVDKATGLKVDISFENVGGLVATKTFNAWKEQWPVMPVLVTVIKQFLLMRGLNEPVNGGLGGFSVICMVVSMLQTMPPIQSGDMDQRHDLGSLLMHFFDLYGNRFNHKTVAISLNPPEYIAKSRVDLVYQNHDRLSILDPNNPSNDVSGGSRNYAQIRACFSSAHKLLQERLQRIAAGERFDSILEGILGGNYSSFREQRDYLRALHEKIHGHCDE